MPFELETDAGRIPAGAMPATAGQRGYVFEEGVREEEGPTLGERMVEEAPQTVGGIAGGIAGATAGIPAGPLGMIIGGAAGAALGGAGGKGYQLAYKSLTGAEDAPQTSYEAAIEMAMAGGEEAAWDLGGQLGARVLGKTFHYLRPKAVDDVEKLAVKLEKAGGQMTAAQRTDSWLIHQLDSLTRGSLTGSGRMQAIDTLNEAALKTLETELRQKIAKNVTENLSDRELGELFLNTVRDGRAAHRTAVSEMYSGFDEITNFAVDTTKLKDSLKPFRDQLERVNWVGESADSKKLLQSMLDQTDTLSFSDAQVLRSNLLDAQRNIEGTVGKSKVSSKINQVVDDLTKAMDEAAGKQGPAALSKYKAIKKYAQTGYKAFDNKFIADMIVADKKNPERIGEYLFRSGNVEEVKQAQKALRYAAKFGKDRGVNYDRVWTQMQKGYLDSILSRTGKQSDLAIGAGVDDVAKQASDVWGSKLVKEFTDPKKSRTMSTVFSKEQQSSILEFAKVAERVQKKPEGGLGMLMQLTQGGAIVGAATGTIDPGEAGAIFLAPHVLARVMTNPKGARLLTTALKTPKTNGRAAAVMSQLAGYVYAVQQKEEGKE